MLAKRSSGDYGNYAPNSMVFAVYCYIRSGATLGYNHLMLQKQMFFFLK